MIKILFVCHGNICRSAAAEMVMNHLLRERKITGIGVESAATSREEIGNDVYPPMKRALTKRGIPCLPHAARQLTASDGKSFPRDTARERGSMLFEADWEFPWKTAM